MKINPIFRLFEIAIVVVIVIFWVSYSIISYYQRMAMDDFWMMAEVNQRGIMGSAIWFYLTWTGGFLGILLENITIYIIHFNRSLLLVYNIFILAFLSGSMFFLFYQVNRILNTKVKPLHIFFISQFIIQALFFSGFAIPENWFWVVGSSGYMYGLCVMFLSLAFLLRYKLNNKQGDFLISCLLAITLGTCVSIVFISVFSCITGMALLFDYYKTGKIDKHNVIYVVLIGVGLAFFVFAPGNFARLGNTTNVYVKDAKHTTFIHEIATVPLIILKKIVLTKLVYMFIFAAPMAYLLTLYITNRHNSIKYSGWLFLSLIIAIYFNVIIMCKVFGWGLGIYHAYLHITLIFICLVTMLLVIVFSRVGMREYIGLGCIFLIAAAAYLNIKTVYIQYPVIKKYATAEDERIAMLLNAKATYTQPILYLDSLPPSGILWSNEIKKDTAYFLNRDMKRTMGLPFAIAVK